MLIANSLLLMATTYAATVNPTDKWKYISTDPSHAEQKIESINFIENAQEKACSLVIFDTSGSMWYDLEKSECATPGEKRNKAVKWAIEYSKKFLDQNDKNEVWLILFWDGAYYEENNYIKNETYCHANWWSTRWQKLSRNSLDINKFWRPWEYTRLDLWLKKAYDVFNGPENKDRCKQKIVVIISDWAPNGEGIAIETVNKNVFTQTNLLKNEGVTIYSIGYWLWWKWTKVTQYWNLDDWAAILWEIWEWLFYKADENDISKIFNRIASKKTTQYTNISSENSKLKINSENLILKWKDYNIIEWNSKYSSILWWKNNYISVSDDSTIIAWIKNIIQFSKNSSILWWSWNLIEWKNTDSEWKNTNDEYKSSENNIIMWWYNNNIKNWINSSIPWWTWNTINGGYSTIVWNNSIITWNYSVAMWHWTKLSWDNSFYRTDPAHNKTPLNHSNVFAILSNSGMVVNTETAHPKAQLTISWTLIVRENTNDENVVCGNGNWKGILKAVKKINWETCFCTCDWDKWKSMYNWSCEAKCDPEILPSCWEKLTLECKENKYVFSGSCNSWKVIDNSYYISTGNKIHWTCQTYDGQTLNCSGVTATNHAQNCTPNNPTPSEPNPPKPGLPGECTWLPDNAKPNNYDTPAKDTKYTYSTDKSKLCTFQCDNGYEYINGECKLKQWNSECKLKFQIEVDGKIVWYNEVHNYVNDIDNVLFRATPNCNIYGDITCDWNKMNICSDCINYPEWNRKNYTVNHILSNIKAVGHPGISVKDGYEYVDWYRNENPLNIDIQWIEEEHLTCNSTFTLKIKSKTKWAGKCTWNEPEGAIPAQWSQTDWLENNIPKTLYSEEDAKWKPCAYVCDSDHVYIHDPNGHKRCLQRGKCTWTAPDNAERVTWIPTAWELEYQLYKTKDEINWRQCAYVCDSNHEYYEDPTTGKKSCIEKTEDNPCGPASNKTYYNQNKLEGKSDFQSQYKDQLCTYSNHTINGTRAGTPVYAQSSTGEIHWECPKSQDVPIPTVRCYAKQEWCGDGVTQSTEECDNGTNNGKNGECSSTCKKNICTEKKTLKGKCQIWFKLQINDKTPTIITNKNIIKINDDNENLHETYDCEKGITKTCDWKMEKCSDCENNPKWQRKNSSVNSILSIIKGKGNSGNGISISDKYEYVDWYRNGCPLNIGIQWIEEEHLTCNSTFILKLKTK